MEVPPFASHKPDLFPNMCVFSQTEVSKCWFSYHCKMIEHAVLGSPGYFVMKQNLDMKDCVPHILRGWKGEQGNLGNSYSGIYC